MATNPKFWMLLGEIQRATVAGETRWHEGFDDDSYRITKPYGLLEVSRRGESAAGEDLTYVAELMDDQGAIAASAIAKMEVSSEHTSPSHEFTRLESLFQAAERSVHPPGGVLDKMLADFSAKRHA